MAFKFSEARSRRDDRGGIGGVDGGTEGAAGGGTGGGGTASGTCCTPSSSKMQAAPSACSITIDSLSISSILSILNNYC